MSEPSPRPRAPWLWLVLLLPTPEFLGVASAASPLARGLGMRGWLPALDLVIYNVPVAAALCFGLGFWWAWGRPARIVPGLFYGALILLGNAFFCWALLNILSWLSLI